MRTASPSALISYSWDSDEHKDWVRELGERLVTNGVRTFLDQWHVRYGESLTEFMEAKIVECDYVIVICTPNYRDRSLARRGGVGYEQQIISGELASGVPRGKFVPIVRSGDFEAGKNCAIPPHFLGIKAIDMRSISKLERSFEELVRNIFDVPLYVPPLLGHRPEFLADDAELEAIRLASPELDGWYLTSVVVRNQLYPETFHILSEVERRSIQPGYYAKLSFEISTKDDENEGLEYYQGERMWVEVIGLDGPYFIGELDNQPVSAVDGWPLKPKDRIVFLPEHILEFMTDEEVLAERKKRLKATRRSKKKR